MGEKKVNITTPILEQNMIRKIGMELFTRDIVRVDKNLSHHYLYFKKYSSDDSRLLFMLLVYFAKQHQHDLFGHGTLDPLQFCKDFNLNPKNYIWKKHSNPRQLLENSREDLEREKVPVFDTIFENSLYCLYSDIFQFTEGSFYYSKVAKYKNGERLNSIQFITSLSKKFVKVGKTNKRVYTYELSEKFLSNLSFLFFNVDIKSIGISSNNNYEGLYFLIKNYINEMMGKNCSIKELKFDEIKEILDIKSDKARYVKQKINIAFNYLLELPDLKNKGLSFEWFKLPNHKFEYGIYFKLKDGAQKEKNEIHKKQIWDEVKFDLLRNMLLAAFKRRYPETTYFPQAELKEKYIRWIKDEKLDPDSKKTAFVDFQKSTNVENIYEKMGFLANHFPQDLAKNYEKYI